MFRGDWSERFALIALAICGILVSAVIIWDVQIRHSYRYADYNAHRQYERDKSADEIAVACGLEVHCISKKLKARDAKNNSNDDLTAQQKMSYWTGLIGWFTALMTLLTALAVFFIWRTMQFTRDALIETKKTVEVTRDIGQAQTRAYVRVKEIVFHLWQNAEFNVSQKSIYTIDAKPRFENIGNTPAIDLVCTCSFVFFLHSQNKRHITLFSKNTLRVSNIAAGKNTIESDFVIRGEFGSESFIGEFPEKIKFENMDSININIVYWYNDVFNQTWFFNGIYNATVSLNEREHGRVRLNFKPLYTHQKEIKVDDPRKHLETLMQEMME